MAYVILFQPYLFIALPINYGKESTPLCSQSLLFGLNPVVLHFAADPLDITLAITLLLTTLWLCQSNKYEVSNKKNPDTPSVGVSASPFWRASFSSVSFYKRACLAGLCIGLGVITRPHLLPIACILPMLLFFKKPLSALAALGGTALVLLTFACTNTAISGQFKLLPTQGAYNLWAANKPGAHGKFFAQSVFIHNQEQHSNPTRVEARTLYLQETHATSPINEATINAYWRNKIITTIVHDPLTWISQMVRKTYYLLNHYEQYNNKNIPHAQIPVTLAQV